MIIRQKYLNQLIAFQDKDLIKVVTGVRRCGKSTLLDMMRNHLAQQGIPHSRLLSFKMESMEYDSIKDYRELYKLVMERIKDIERPYLFFDELQEIAGWERAINSLRVDVDCDIYITGSNAYLLSSELSTMLSGRYVEIEMLPLTFSEYLDFRGAQWFPADSTQADLVQFHDGTIATLERLFEQYKTYGGLPFLASSEPSRTEHRTYCKTLYDTVVVRDILERDKRRDQRKLTNPELLVKVCNFLADNVGNENSVNSITKALKSDGMRAANDTVEAYIVALCEAYLFYPVKRFDIKGKEHLKTNGKHYVVDTGIRNYLQGYRNADAGRVFENIVYLQLLFEGYDISIGTLRAGEIDFVACKPDEKFYLQVTEDMTDPSTLERELAPLKAVRDAYPKIVVALNGNYPREIDGIKIIKGVDFLLGR